MRNNDRDFLIKLIIEMRNAIEDGDLAYRSILKPIDFVKGRFEGSRVAMESVIERIEEYLEGNPE